MKAGSNRNKVSLPRGSDLDLHEDDMEFRLTYAGKLLSTNDRNEQRLKERSLHVHDVRKSLHPQMKLLWDQHPALREEKRHGPRRNPGGPQMYEVFNLTMD